MSKKRKSIYKQRGSQIEDFKVVESFNKKNPKELNDLLNDFYLPIVKDLLIHDKGIKKE